jgi:hypothetical protein
MIEYSDTQRNLAFESLAHIRWSDRIHQILAAADEGWQRCRPPCQLKINRFPTLFRSESTPKK